MHLLRLPIMLIAFLLALVPLTVMGTDNGTRDCILEADAGNQSAALGQPANGSLSVRVVEPDPAVAESTVTVVCSAKVVETISVLLPPRREAIIGFVLTNHAAGDARFNVTMVAPEGVGSDWPANWLTISPLTGLAMAAGDVPVRVALRSVSELAPGSTHELKLMFELVEDDNVSVVEMPVRIEIQGEDPMFRDRFEVDPVLGQFSYRAPRSRQATWGAEADLPAGTGE